MNRIRPTTPVLYYKVQPMANSTTQKPAKPHPDFPLFPHASGQWAKKVQGRLRYFGVWNDPQAALKKWIHEKDDLLAGREPRPQTDSQTVADVCNAFLRHRKSKLASGELRQRTWDEYKRSCETMIRVFGRNRIAVDIRPEDFAALRDDISQGRRPKTVGNEIGRIATVLSFINNSGMLESPIVTGVFFQRPTKKQLRIDRASQEHMGIMMLDRKAIRAVLKKSPIQIKAMTLLAVNTGMGNEDCGRLEFRHVDLKAGWLDYARPKTGIRRRAKLWPETVTALEKVIATRDDDSKKLAHMVFVTKYGQCWAKEGSTNPISHEFRKLLKETDNYTKGVGFYSLRRTFETIAAETNDQPAIDLSMGHESPDMGTLYRQRLGDDRLKAVSKHVRKWLFGKRGAK